MFSSEFVADLNPLGISNNQYFTHRPFAVPHVVDMHIASHECQRSGPQFTFAFANAMPSQPRSVTVTALEVNTQQLPTLPPAIIRVMVYPGVAVPEPTCQRTPQQQALDQMRNSARTIWEPQKFVTLRPPCPEPLVSQPGPPLQEFSLNVPYQAKTVAEVIHSLSTQGAVWGLDWTLTDDQQVQLQSRNSDYTFRFWWASEMQYLRASFGGAALGATTLYTDLLPGGSFTFPNQIVFPLVTQLFLRVDDHGQPRTFERTTLSASTQYHQDVLARIRLSRESNEVIATESNGRLTASTRMFAPSDNNRLWTQVSFQFIDGFSGQPVIPRSFMVSLRCETL